MPIASPPSHLLLAHGSHASDIGLELEKLCQSLSHRLAGATVTGAFLSVGSPTLPEAVEDLVARGSICIRIQPLFLFSGKHSREDMPRLNREMRERFPGIDFSWSPLLPDLAGFSEFLAAAMDEKGDGRG